jgi:hypothetical protein
MPNTKVLFDDLIIVPVDLTTPNKGISAASFCRQEAALVPDMFCNFYLVKNHKIANNSATTELEKK